jgi:CDGSH-type Zn-finger protein
MSTTKIVIKSSSYKQSFQNRINNSMRVECWCGKTLDKDKRCDGSHNLTPEEYITMKERISKRKRNRVKKESTSQ